MRNKKAVSQTLAVVIVVLVLAATFGGYAIGTIERNPQINITTTVSTTYTSTIYASPAITFVTNTTFYTASTVQNPCSLQYANGMAPLSAPKVFAPQNSSVMVCTRLYYYNSTSTKSFNTSSVLGVGVGDTSSQPSKMDFRVTAYPSEVTIGGVSNVSEGTLVLYTISTGDTSNGTYVIGFQAALYPSLELCGVFAQFIVNNPFPSYGYHPSCTTPVQGLLSVEVIGLSNSTMSAS